MPAALRDRTSANHLPSPDPCKCKVQKDHSSVVRGIQGSHMFSWPMTQKGLGHKVMSCVMMLKIFGINRPDGRLGRYSLQGCRAGYAARFPSNETKMSCRERGRAWKQVEGSNS